MSHFLIPLDPPWYSHNFKEDSPEGVMVVVIGSLELEKHKINSPDGANEEENLHCSVVEGYEVGEQIEIAGEEHQGEEAL